MGLAQQFDKKAAIDEAHQEAFAKLSSLVGVNIRGEEDLLLLLNRLFGTQCGSIWELPLLQEMLPAGILKLKEFAEFMEAEMNRCLKACAFFSACIAGGAGIETLLTLLCLLDQEKVQYHPHLAKKMLKVPNFETAVSALRLDQLIEIAVHFHWIPAVVVNATLIEAIANGYSELAEVAFPERGHEEIEATAESLRTGAGFSLLTLIRELRNHVHAGRWLSKNQKLDIRVLEEWCKFGVVMIGEVSLCLGYRTTKLMMANLDESIARATLMAEPTIVSNL